MMGSEPEERSGGQHGPARGDILRCSRREQDGWAVIEVAGEVDWATVPILRAAIAGPLTRPSPRVVLDMAEVAFLDSSGLSVLVRAHRQSSKRGGRLAVVGLRPSIRKILRMTDADRVLCLHPTVADAIARDARPRSRQADDPMSIGLAYGIDDWMWPGGSDVQQFGLN